MAMYMITTFGKWLAAHMTYRGPAENGVYAKESFVFIFSAVNRSGSNFCILSNRVLK